MSKRLKRLNSKFNYGIIGVSRLCHKDFPVRRSFTLFEVVLVIVVIGILAALVIPRLQNQRLDKATLVFIDALRYTQHLAMVDDKYIADPTLSPYSDPVEQTKSSKQWFKQWWRFWVWNKDGGYSSSCDRSGPGIAVFSDRPTNNSANNAYNDNISLQEAALDPKNGSPMAACISETGKVNDEYNLKKKYGIKRIDIDSPCSRAAFVSFDEQGRPFCVYPTSDSDSLTPYKYPLTSPIRYTLCANDSCDENASVCVEIQTGFVYRCD
jgi:prepilin-type N-terminal cleavage/methylation domain-containing protein